MNDLLVVFVLVAVIIVLLFLLRKARSGSGEPSVSIYSTIEHLKAIGHLSVFKAITKEIVTETDHSWGDFGKKYLSWVLSNKKMAMIFEFEIDVRYDLRREEFEITPTGPDAYRIVLPPSFYEVYIRDMKFYDEQGARLLPWLLPDLLNGFLPAGFSEEDKNRLVQSARKHADNQARELIDQLQPEVQNAAKAVLESISKAFGAKHVEFSFLKAEHPDVNVAYKAPAAA